MDTHEIVVHEVDCHHVRVVRGFFRECVGEPRHATVAHPDIQILPFRAAGRNMLGIRIALKPPLRPKATAA